MFYQISLVLIISILIVVISIITPILIIKNGYLKKLEQKLDTLTNENKNLIKMIIEEKEKIFKISEEYFDKGLKEGVSKNNITIRVDPIENTSGRDYWIYSSEKIEIGYKYTLINNNIPSQFTTTHFTKTIAKSKIKEENINAVINTINEIQSLNPKTFIVNTGFELIKQNLQKHLPKKN